MQTKFVLLLAAALLATPCINVRAQTPAANVESAALPWTAGAGTREVEGGATLENDLVFASSGQVTAGYYPQANVVSWGVLPATQPGRYRATFRARTEKIGDNNLALQAWIPQDAGGIFTETQQGWVPLPIGSTPVGGRAFDAPGKWQEFSLEFDVEVGKPVALGLVFMGTEKPQAGGKIQVEKSSLRLVKSALPVSFSHARPVKLRYKHSEAGMLEVRLSNSTSQAQTAQVRPVVISDMGQSTPGEAKTIAVPAHQTVSAQIPFKVPAADGGYELSAELVNGAIVVDRRGDVFAVSDNPFLFSMSSGNAALPYLGPAAFYLKKEGFRKEVLGNWDKYVKDSTVAMERLRRDYVTYFEYFAWAREDATAMVEASDEPYLSGQVFYPASRKQLLLLNTLMKNHGIAPVAYLNAVPFGWPGFLLVRERPEWFQYNAVNGQLAASFDTNIMEKYFNDVQVEGNVYPSIGVNYEAPSPIDSKKYLDFHQEQLVASAKYYGWEGYRYDAAPLPTQYFPQVKQMLAKLNPPVAVGNNLSIIVLGPKNSPGWKTYTAGGSLMMDESNSSAFNSPQDPNHRWRDWTNFIRTGSNITRSNGGHYTFINNTGNWLSTALGYACGAHPYSFKKSSYGDQERFMVRYGHIFWDLKTQMMPDAEKVVDVSSTRPLWWKTLVSQRVLSAANRQIIVPLFNAPEEEVVLGTTINAPAEDALVSFSPKPGEKVTAWLLSPEPVARRVELPTKTLGDGRVQVSVPKFWSWANVVFECRTG